MYLNYMTTKALRLSKQEEQLINEFLEKNPMFDFSTLARVAILNFIERPEIKLTPIKNRNIENNKMLQ